MAGKIILSTAYLPPVEYFFHLKSADEILIEYQENYIKQTYRNRCYIVSANGIQLLTVPVLLGSFHKTAVRDIRIDYSKRWQQVHLRAINASYRSSPFFQFYYEDLEAIIIKNHEFLLDLNIELLTAILKTLNLKKELIVTTAYEHSVSECTDLRDLSPKKPGVIGTKTYPSVFGNGDQQQGIISIIDMIFNLGPDVLLYI
jgi:hypothetical protein